MKESTTTRGKTYAVTSANGCTVTTEDGTTLVEAEAGTQGYFVAVSGKVTLSDDSAIVTQVFKLAPYQKLRLLGVVGGGDPAWLKTLREELTALLDGSAFNLAWLSSKKQLVVHTDRLSDELLAEVTDMLERFVPGFIEVYHEPFPLNYTKVEWLRGRVNPESWHAGSSYIILNDLNFRPEEGDLLEIETEITIDEHPIFKSRQYEGIRPYDETAIGKFQYGINNDIDIEVKRELTRYDAMLLNFGEYTYGDEWLHFKVSTGLEGQKAYVAAEVNGNRKSDIYPLDIPIKGIVYNYIGLWVCTRNDLTVSEQLQGKRKYYKLSINGKILYDMVPALDDVGAPCLFDLVSRKPFYNAGTGDFLYPTESTTYSLRRTLPDWGKLTDHGLRRLYHAPASWQGELYDYALENGFKPIVEPEKPEEGYWAPRWRETEDEILLEWVETEPPTDEIGLPEETLTETE